MQEPGNASEDRAGWRWHCAAESWDHRDLALHSGELQVGDSLAACTLARGTALAVLQRMTDTKSVILLSLVLLVLEHLRLWLPRLNRGRQWEAIVEQVE
jgi:hypothetical protein